MRNSVKINAREELVAEASRIAATKVKPGMSADEKDELLEATMMDLLDRKAGLPWFADVESFSRGGNMADFRGDKKFLMHSEPRLPQMPEKPTLIDFMKRRILVQRVGGRHLLQSAKLAQKNGLPEKLVLACLLHDIAVICHIRTDHGYYGAQMIEPYVDEEVSWAIRYHQALRFFPDPSVGYEYPESYAQAFGEDYVPPPYVQKAAEKARNHKWYMSARLVTMNDLYAFDPDAEVDVEDFTDIIGRHFRQPADGLGFDDSPAAHMWRTVIWPNNYL